MPATRPEQYACPECSCAAEALMLPLSSWLAGPHILARGSLGSMLGMKQCCVWAEVRNCMSPYVLCAGAVHPACACPARGAPRDMRSTRLQGQGLGQQQRAAPMAKLTDRAPV